jgi:hypothetical protein
MRMDLLYSEAYNLACELRLASGRLVTLRSLDQQMTYTGLLEGRPSTAVNDGIIKRALDVAQRYCVPGAKPHLIAPVRRDFRRQGDTKPVHPLSKWAPEWIPGVRCIGSFTSVSASPSRRPLSSLVLVWFQDAYALPMLDPALTLIQAVDWESLASEYEV